MVTGSCVDIYGFLANFRLAQEMILLLMYLVFLPCPASPNSQACSIRSLVPVYVSLRDCDPLALKVPVGSMTLPFPGQDLVAHAHFARNLAPVWFEL